MVMPVYGMVSKRYFILVNYMFKENYGDFNFDIEIIYMYVLSKESFILRVALLLTINDFPAYGMLSRRSVNGYNACPVCMNETSSHYLTHSRKVCYMGHRRFLPSSNQWRRDKKNFDGKVDIREPIIPKSGHEILSDVDSTINEPYCFVNKRKRKNVDGERG